jgi:hypothetical protein
MKSAFDPHLRLCAGNMAHLKAIDGSVDFLADGTFWAHVQSCLYSASRIQRGNRGDIIPLLDELDRTGGVLAKKISKNQHNWSFLETGRDGFTNSLLAAGQWVPSHPLLSDPKFRDKFGCHFLSLAVRYGVVEYVEAKVNQGCLVQQIHNKVWPLIRDATHVNARWKSECHDAVPSVEMIACLLNRGADPNFLIPVEGEATSHSVWGQALVVVFENFDGITIKPPWAAIARLMIEHGAEVSKDVLRSLVETVRLTNFGSWGLIGWRAAKLYEHLSAIKKATAGSWVSWLRWIT